MSSWRPSPPRFVDFEQYRAEIRQRFSSLERNLWMWERHIQKMEASLRAQRITAGFLVGPLLGPFAPSPESLKDYAEMGDFFSKQQKERAAKFRESMIRMGFPDAGFDDPSEES